MLISSEFLILVQPFERSKSLPFLSNRVRRVFCVTIYFSFRLACAKAFFMFQQMDEGEEEKHIMDKNIHAFLITVIHIW